MNLTQALEWADKNSALEAVERLRSRQVVQVLAAEVRKLQAWIEGDCFCPCCETYKECMSDCTFKDDDPSAADRMNEARKVLYGTE